MKTNMAIAFNSALQTCKNQNKPVVGLVSYYLQKNLATNFKAGV